MSRRVVESISLHTVLCMVGVCDILNQNSEFKYQLSSFRGILIHFLVKNEFALKVQTVQSSKTVCVDKKCCLVLSAFL